MNQNITNPHFNDKPATFLEGRWQFLFLFWIVFFFTFLFFSIIGFVPEYTPKEPVVSELSKDNFDAVEYIVAPISKFNDPVHITIPDVSIDVNVENPQSRDVDVLDKALYTGAVHYPGTGSLTEDANIFIFGHSSFLPNVINKNYQAFNGLKKLKGGEEIFVDSEDTRYVYTVMSVRLAEAEEIKIELNPGVRKLTLSTCNSFGAESERYIIDADFVRVEVL